MRRRAINAFLLLFLVLCGSAEGRDRAMWEQYKKLFLSDDGRVIDYFQDRISHSEGQGYGMWLAVLNDDRRAFDAIWGWTRSNLQVRSDSLLAWQWGKRPNNEWRVIDYNDAADGDILVAYALLLARDAWQHDAYRDEALRIIRDVRTHLAVPWQDRTFLLPGWFGFNRAGGYLLNPSHVIPAAFRAFAAADQRDFWEKAEQDGLFLIGQSCRGTWKLPLDWVIAQAGGIAPAPGQNPYFGDNAVRILLYHPLTPSSPYAKGIAKVLDLYRRTGLLPLWVDPEQQTMSLRPAPAGYYAVYALAAKQLGDARTQEALVREARQKLSDEKSAYYSYSLYLLASAAMDRDR